MIESCEVQGFQVLSFAFFFPPHVVSKLCTIIHHCDFIALSFFYVSVRVVCLLSRYYSCYGILCFLEIIVCLSNPLLLDRKKCNVVGRKHIVNITSTEITMIQLFFSIQSAFAFIINPCKDDVSYANPPMNRGHTLCISSFLLQGDARKRAWNLF